MPRCPDPTPALRRLECYRSDNCSVGLSDADFPFLTSTDERAPTFLERIAFWGWIWQAVAVAAITAFLAWLQREDVIPDPFDISVISYIGSVALAAAFYGAYSSLAGFATEQVTQFRNMGNAVTSFAGDLAGAITPAAAQELMNAQFLYPYYPYDCNGPVRQVTVSGRDLICFLTFILQSAVYSTTRFLSDDGVDVDKLPLKYALLRNEVHWHVSKRNANEPSVLMRMALRIVMLMREQDLVIDDAWGTAAGNVGDFNSAIGALAIAKEVRVTRYSNAWLRIIVFLTTPFIPLALDFSLEVKIIFSFLLAMVLYSTIAIAAAQANVTDLDNPIAGARLKDEDDPIAAATVAEIAGIASLVPDTAEPPPADEAFAVVSARYGPAAKPRRRAGTSWMQHV